MRKLLISILAILLAVLIYFLMFSHVKIAQWTSTNIEDIKAMSVNLDDKIGQATQLNSQEYPEKVDKLEESIKELKKAKEKYTNKIKYISDNVELGVVTIKRYKIERLWITLQNYAKKEGIELKLDIIETAATDTYNLEITLTGSYIGITDFIYDIEKDDTLGFKILNFKLLPYAITTTETEAVEEKGTGEEPDTTKIETVTKTTVDVSKLNATFNVEGVGIDFN